MTSTSAVTREEIHQRQITMRVYRRSDGLFDATAHLTDRKTGNFQPRAGIKVFPAGSPIHDLGITLTFDADMIVRHVETFMASHPYTSCPGGGDTLRNLVGVRIGSGWNRKVRELLPNCDTCTHLKELLGPMATAAIQGMVEVRPSSLEARDSSGRPTKIDSCHAYAATRDLVRNVWPEHFQPSPREEKS